MIRRECDEDAVSAAIATVLLFAGVITIISGMMVTVIPVIDELHGAVERENMVGQMEDLAKETERLSESGTPGDSALLTMRPHTGQLGWQMFEGGSWYSATHIPDTTFRIEGALDLDQEMRIRHPEYPVNSLCATDLHASEESLHHYRIPLINATITATPSNTLTSVLGSKSLTFEQGGIETEYLISSSDTWIQNTDSSTGESWIHSEMPLNVIVWHGQGGAFIANTDMENPDSGLGRIWSVPLIGGSHVLQVESDNPFTVQWEIGSESGNGQSTSLYVEQNPEGALPNVHTWTQELVTSEPEKLVLRTSSDASLVVRWGESAELDGEGPGAISWPDRTGSWTGKNFRPPAMDGTLIINNPSPTSTTAKIGNLYQAISGYSSIRIPWTSDSLSWIEGSDPIQIEWVLDSQTLDSNANHATSWRPGSLTMIPAADTGRTSGAEWKFYPPKSGGDSATPAVGETSLILQPAGPRTTWNTATSQEQTINHSDDSTIHSIDSNHIGAFSVDATSGSLRIFSSTGDSGAIGIQDDGADRCIVIGMRASGWIDVTLPWISVHNYKESDILSSWKDGSHFFGLQMEIRGEYNGEPNTVIASAWAFHMPRLTYTFDSSVSDLQILTQGGFVGTNHPEYQPDVLRPPASREGPGPRLAATVPVTVPTGDSVLGSTELELTLSLEGREQITSLSAHQVRRGWDGPYALTIAAESAADADYSSDWLAFPGQLDTLSDYVGWVQTSPTMPEVVYHAGGGPVLFNLQMACISSQTSLGGSIA
ncbi:MAG: hypothetical protein CMB37_02260 [Euryarchaeota archaeon]|nr:hypothetical protein [Euryarchaeota archaeon]